MWTLSTQGHPARAGLRYGSDLTDPEWTIPEPLRRPVSRGRHLERSSTPASGELRLEALAITPPLTRQPAEWRTA